MAKFTHLHVHSEYSLLDGLPKIKKLVARVKELGMTAVALTDHGTMYGAIEFYKECLTQEVNPILGMEGYIVTKDHREKKTSEDKENSHIVLLASDYGGYQNLMKISTIAHLEGFYYRPRISREILKKYAKGLICLSACPKSEIGRYLIGGDYGKAKEIAHWYQEVFGNGRYFLEIQRHRNISFINKENDQRINDRLEAAQKAEDLWVKGTVQLSRELGIPLVATNDVHYLRQNDSFAQDVLVCISTGRKVSEFDRLRYVDTPTFHLTSEKEMEQLFADLPDAVKNSNKIAQQIKIEISLGKWFFPKIEIPEGKTAEDYLRERALQQFGQKYDLENREAKERLEYELEVIINKGYPSYFLMMADLVNWCREHGIITNTRGSAAGSVTSYVLGITNVDPLKYGIPFERFLNPYRPKPPDIDLDVADNHREEVLAYIVKTYGQDKTAQICTFGRMLARAAVRDVGRVLGHPYSFPDKIAKLIPFGSQGFSMTIDHAIEITPELEVLYKTDQEAKKILDVAKEIEGNARHASVHAAGVVVSPTATTDFSPLQLEPNGEKIITQYEMHACEDVGLVKFDILGIRNLSILGAAVKIIERERKTKIDLEKLRLDDKKTFAMLTRGETMGVFQLGGSGMTKWLKELKPNRVEDLMVMVALFRPGPMANIPEYIARKNKRRPITFIHPKMKEFLDKSYGILVYQEDVLFTALALAGYSWETVDKLRLAIGKKIPEEMAKQHKIFVKGCQDHSSLSEKDAEKLWELFVPFQGYGFNKAHAASYGLVAYQTAYLKAHYPVEYMTALLTAESGDTEKVTEAVEECRRMKIVVRPPDINCSQVDFTVEDEEKSLESKAIRFGLSAIKNVGEAAIQAILKARKSATEFKSVADFCQKVDSQKVNKKVFESLIKSGAMNRFGKRAAMLSALEKIRAKGAMSQREKANGQTSLFSDQQEQIEDNLPDIEEFSRQELLLLEKELLGFYLTDHPLTPLLSLLSAKRSHRIEELGQLERKKGVVNIGGIVSSLRVVLTKNRGEEMAFARIEDESASIEVVIFPKVYSKTRNCWVKERAVFVKGKLETRDETQNLIVDNAWLLEETETLEISNDGFEIKIPSQISPRKLVELNSLLKQNPGKDKVSLAFFDNFDRIRKMELPFGVNYSKELKEQIKKIIE